MLSKSYIEKRAEKYRKLAEDAKTGKREVYIQKSITLPATLMEFCAEHPEIKVSSIVARELYELKKTYDKREFLEKHGDLYEQCKEILGEDTALDVKETKRTLDILKFYFSARNIGNEIGMAQARDTMENVNPKVHKAIMDMELYILKHPEYADKIKNITGFSEITDIIKSTVKKYDV